MTIPNSVTGFVAATVADWNNDGADDIWLQQSTTLDSLVTLSYVPDLLNSVSNGMGAVTTVTYDRINKNGSVYTKGTGAVFPTQDVDAAIYVVTQVDANNGLGTCVPVAGSSGTNCFTRTYAYAGAKTDVHGRGFLGYSTVTIKDLQTGIVTTTTYNTAFPYTGTVASQTAVTTLTRNGCVAGKTLQSVSNTYTATNLGGTRNLVLPSQAVSAPGDCDGSALPSTTIAYSSYDAYGNPLVTTTTLSDGSSVTTTDTFSNDAVNWFIGRMTSTTVTKVVGASTVTRTSSFLFDPATGLMTRETIEPGSIYTQQTDYTYDAFGHRVTATVSGAGGGAIAPIPNHVSSAGYDSIGQFQTSATGPDGYTETFTYDARFGTVATHADVNGLVTSWTYDGFARKTKETRPDGNVTVYTYPASCGGTCPGTSVFEAKAVPNTAASVQNGPSVAVFYDALGRETLNTSDGFAQPINVATVYDTSGNVVDKSRPYFTGGSVLYTSYVYDDLGRAVSATAPNAGVTTVAYHGLSSTATNPNLEAATTLRNAQGLVASVTDAASHATSYVYDAYGNLTKVTDALGNVTSNTYDLRGNKTASTDPDLGHWTYGYDALGELVAQTDAKGQVTTLTYDLMGHPTQRVEADLTSTWTYGTAAPNKHHLVSENATGTAGLNAGGGFTRAIGYDSLSRPNSSAATFGSGGSAGYAVTYNADGRIDTVTYPSGFVAKYVYTALGYLSQIKDNASGAAVYTVNARDAELHLTQGTAGNGVAESDTFDPDTGLLTDVRAGPSNGVAQLDFGYDKLGNLTSRSDDLEGVFEKFCYDNLNRLTSSATAQGTGPSACTSTGTGITSKTIGYDAIGDITSKSDVGTYSYPASGASSVRPHAVSSIVGTVNGVTNPTYTYDADGNLTAGAGFTVTPSSFNMALNIVQGTTTVNYVYGPEHERIRRIASVGSAHPTTRYISDPASGSTEENDVTDGIWKDYLKLDGRMVAERDCTGAALCTTGATWTYFTADHLGSTAVLTNGSGSVTERDSYDAWGRRRNTDGTDNTACAVTSATDIGYTGHEQMDSVCQVNAGARVYDPTLGRFMAADTMVSDASDGQAFNRYSYVNNRPLSVTDPSGNVPVEQVTVTGAKKYPTIPDTISDFPSAMGAPSGGSTTRGAAQSGYGAAYRITITITKTVNVTGTRIPQNVTNSISFDVNIPDDDETEQAKNSNSSDTEACDNAQLDDGVYHPNGTKAGGLIPVVDKDGIIHWETEPGHPFAATPQFLAKFVGSPEEVAVVATILEISEGDYPIRELRTGQELQLPGRSNTYDVYSVGPPDDPGLGRIAHVDGTNVYFYSPYHYNMTEDVPNAWVQINFPDYTNKSGR